MSLILLFTWSTNASAQKSKLKLAKKFYDGFEFTPASDIYKDILSSPKHKDDTTALRMIADCQKRLGNYGVAEKYLEQLATTPFVKSDDLHNLAEVLRIQKKYPEVLQTYQRILDKNPNDKIAAEFVSNPNFAEEILADSMIYKIRSAKINSPASDFAPGFFTGNRLLFSSSRGLGVGARRYYAWNSQPYLNIYQAEILPDTTLDKVSVLNSDVNSRYHEGTISYDPANNLMYLTRNNFVRGSLHKSKTGRVNLAMYTVSYKNGDWGALEPFALNNKEYSVGHPSLTKSGTRIYFVSDMPGGMGGTDIYYADRDGEKWGSAVNAGPRINTSADEMFPFIVGDSTLYFSSRGHVGLGGFDLYNIAIFDSTAKAQNLGYPVNSNYDDFSALVYPSETAGFFCSNRPGGKGDDDIYEFVVRAPEFVDIAGRVVDQQTLEPIADAIVMVESPDGGLIEVTTDKNGEYVIKAPYKPIIRLDAKKADFIPGSVEVPTNIRKTEYKANDIFLKKEDIVAIGNVVYDVDGSPAGGALVRVLDSKGTEIGRTIVAEDGTYSVAIPENQKVTLEVTKNDYVKLTKDVDTRGKKDRKIKNDFRLFKLEKGTVVRLDNIYYDYGKAEIRPDAALELNKLVTILKDNPTMKIELSSHTDARGGDAYNLNLSDKRAKSAVQYIISQGIDASRLVGKGYGETKLLNRCGNDVKCSEEEHQFNRRTEFKILDV